MLSRKQVDFAERLKGEQDAGIANIDAQIKRAQAEIARLEEARAEMVEEGAVFDTVLTPAIEAAKQARGL
jgi:hypothetical protein